jgi:hypothetical protein
LLAWTAEIAPTGRFFVLLDTGSLQAQLQMEGAQTSLLVTFAPPGAGRQERTQTVSLPPAAGYRQWTLTRADGQIRLELDGQDVLVAPDAGSFHYLRLGETRTDAEHGGTLRLRALRYTRTLV